MVAVVGEEARIVEESGHLEEHHILAGDAFLLGNVDGTGIHIKGVRQAMIAAPGREFVPQPLQDVCASPFRVHRSVASQDSASPRPYLCTMNERPQRRTLLLFTVLSVYVVLQFTWWAVLLLRKDRAAQELAVQVQALGGTPAGLVDPARSARMVMGEAAVVLLILLAILWLTFRALRRDLGVARTQRNFLLAVTHELRSPIASIKLQLQTLARPGLTAEQQATLRNTALSEAERLTGLTDKVLMATKADDGLMPLEPTALDAVQVVTAVVERARTGSARGHTIHFKAPPQLPVTMDQQALHSIADNLVENAAKYAPEGTDIAVLVDVLKDQWRLSVSDQGPGIPLSEQARIFEKFYRSGNEETRSAKGTGLGLYIVQRLVQRSGGVITVRCGAQQGTTFAATFPLR